MKKYILLVSLLVSTFTAPAQDLGVYEYTRTLTTPLRTLYHKVTRYIANEQKLPWILAFQRQSAQATPMRFSGLKWDGIPPQPQPSLAGQALEPLVGRLVGWQQQLRHHLALRTFTLEVLTPREMASFSAKQAEVLTGFLQNGSTVGRANPRYVPAKTEEFKHYIVRLTFQPAGEKPFYLTANCYTHELFLSLSPTVPGVKLEPLPPAIQRRHQ